VSRPSAWRSSSQPVPMAVNRKLSHAVIGRLLPSLPGLQMLPAKVFLWAHCLAQNWHGERCMVPGEAGR
ncbi:MAG: hypothetical protein WA384_14985, partial [Rhodomicrobium sp.]